MSSFTILHVEDDANDAFFVKRALDKAGLGVTVMRVCDGEEALEYLAGTGAFVDRRVWPVPQAVLLDLKMPILSGFDVLMWLRGRSEYRELPVVVLSSSDHSQDKSRAKELGATDYLLKSLLYEDVVEYVRELMQPARAAA